MRTTIRLSLLFAAAGLAASALAGCSGTPGGGPVTPGETEASAAAGGGATSVCEVLTDDTRTAATLFAAVIPQMNTVDEIKARLALLDAVPTPPEGLEADWEAWREFLVTASESIDDDPTAVIQAYASVSDAGERLSDFYTGTCL